ncbi:hypothetical protein NX059_008443 [Plenodomus lindquistii]|nr:hypothetical protein NX059_008443 [Plenodomus lindquistii]
MVSKLSPLLALCASVCFVAAHSAASPSEARSTAHNGRYAMLPIWTEDSGMSYMINITLGSDNQTIPLKFDTDSSETLVNPDCWTLTDDDAWNKCFGRERYNLFSSANSKFTGGSFSLSFGGGESQAAGIYISDDMQIGGAAITAKHIGLISTSRNFDSGVFGAGRSAIGESPSIIEQMVTQSEVSSHAFSIDLGPLKSAEPGTVIFGGIDTKRYKGNLTLLEGSGFNTYLTGISLTLPNRTRIIYDSELPPANTPRTSSPSTPGLPITLSTSSPYTLIPPPLLEKILLAYPSVVKTTSVTGDQEPQLQVPCTNIQGGSFDYTFSALTIHVPLPDTLIRLPHNKCGLPFAAPSPATAGSEAIPFRVGNGVMRATYTVFDLRNEMIWMGERADCGSEVVTMEGGMPIVEGCGGGDDGGV